MKFTGQIEPFISRFTQDSIPKNCLLAHAYEAFEIGAYRALLGAAEELDMEELRTMCERYIREEQQMASFLFEHLPEIARQFLRSRGAKAEVQEKRRCGCVSLSRTGPPPRRR